jgi:hypothetical protein
MYRGAALSSLPEWRDGVRCTSKAVNNAKGRFWPILLQKSVAGFFGQ